MSMDDYRHKGLRRKLVEDLAQKGITDARVLEAMGRIPRHLFIDDSAFLGYAYQDTAFPIGCGQTISQPWTVAFQTQLLAVKPGLRVLEIGTGSGYQTAVLLELGCRVFSIERHKPLHIRTKERLTRMGYRGMLYHGDGYLGLPKEMPFDRVLVTCGAPEVPTVLRTQLKVGGTMVIPLGEGATQVMVRLVNHSLENQEITEHGKFRFVPMLEEKAG